MEARLITNEDIRRAARQAYDEGRLGAQNMEAVKAAGPEGAVPNGCVYHQRIGGRLIVCAIGAVLTEEELARAMELSTLANTNWLSDDLHDRGVVRFENPVFANDIQKAHDTWTGSPDKEAAFLRCLTTFSEERARRAGWVSGGDAPGFIFHEKTWGSWKAATSWSGDEGMEPNGPDDHPALYDNWDACCEAEDL